MERLRSRSALPPGLQVSASLIVSEAVYFPMSVSQTSDTVLGDQICLSASQPVFVQSLYVHVLCVCVPPLPPTLAHTKKRQEEQGAEQSPCHSTVWTPSYSERWQAQTGAGQGVGVRGRRVLVPGSGYPCCSQGHLGCFQRQLPHPEFPAPTPSQPSLPGLQPAVQPQPQSSHDWSRVDAGGQVL